MSAETDYQKLYEAEKKKVGVLEQKLRLYENDPEKNGYFALRKIVNQQVDILNVFNLNLEIGANPKEDKKYDRVKALWESLKPMLIDLKALKTELKISPDDEEREKQRIPFIETVAETRR